MIYMPFNHCILDELFEPKNHYSKLSGECISNYLVNYIQKT